MKHKMGLIRTQSLLIAITISFTFLNHATNQNFNQVQCSSYLDDYFLPTAKLAFNKIQQSLSPSSTSSEQQQQQQQSNGDINNQKSTPTSINNLNATNVDLLLTKSQTQLNNNQQQVYSTTNYDQQSGSKEISNTVPASIAGAGAAVAGTVNNEKEATASETKNVWEEPNKNEFVKLIETNPQDFAPNNAPSLANMLAEPAQTTTTATTTDLAPSSSLPSVPLVVSSTQATDSDPTLNTSQEQQDNNPAQVQSTEKGANPSLNDVPVISDSSFSTQTITSTPTTTTTTTEAAATTTIAQNIESTEEEGGGRGKAGMSYAVEPTNDQPAIVAADTKQQQTDSIIESKSAEEAAFKETELEAVAAVDASIGFGPMDLFTSMTDLCYDEYGNARYCEPEFENAAFEKLVEVSSECGQPPSRFCTAFLNEHNDQIRNCHICDAQNPKKRHPASYLTDLNNFNNPTCWVSAPITASASGNSNNNININNTTNDQQQQQQQQQQFESDNVTLTLNLDKKYEITYISMQFCSMKPDSLAIYKSMDYGRTWLPYQFYSSQCRRMYGRQSRSIASAGAGGSMSAGLTPGVVVSGSKSLNDLPGATAGALIEPNCLNSSQLAGANTGSQSAGASSSSARIAFSPLDGRVSGGAGNSAVEKSAALQDWITATNIRIVLDRHQASNWMLHPSASASSSSHSTHHHHHHTQHHAQESKQQAANSSMLPSVLQQEQPQQQPQQQQQQFENSLTSPSDTFNYAMSDLTLGARCKCNGHASRCIHNKDGSLQCDCRHNTAGRDCERCAAFHHDRPWARATQLDANPCQPCNCNGHSRKCRFDAELYRLSGKRSGGVCSGCRDNTAGRHCHYCKEGFTRDHSKPMSDKEACKHCDCHPIGSLHRVCNLTTGQCACKEGVAGLQCNRCAAGYQQSSSLSEPCIKLPENDINYEPSLTVDGSVDEEQQQQQQTEPQTSNAIDQRNPPVSATNNNNNNNDNNEPRIAIDESARRSAPSGVAESKLSTMDNVAESADGVDGITDVNNPSTNQNNDSNNNKEDDSEDSELESSARKQLRLSGGGSSHWNQRDQASSQTKYSNYYNKGAQRSRQYKQPVSPIAGLYVDDEQPSSRARMQPSSANNNYAADIMTDDESASNEYASNPRAAAGRSPQTYSQYNINNNDYNKRFIHPEYRRRPARPISSVDHGDDMMIYDDQETPVYVAPPNSMYNDEEFNQIHHPTQPMLNGRHKSHQPNPYRNGQTNVYRPKVLTNRQRGFSVVVNDEAQQQQQQPSQLQPQVGVNSISCGDCQTGTRRLVFKQFCHLDYAIKATLLSKFAAQDWTRFDVEVQDIFKSPTSPIGNSMLHPSLRGARGLQQGYLNNVIQDENANHARMSSNASSTSSQHDTQAAIESHYRIKVGTIHSIWVPTEDLSCKCPKLKTRATYLLMGSVDAKENSVNWFQLDRHGVALEWRASLQEKLIKYQRRHSRGRC